METKRRREQVAEAIALVVLEHPELFRDRPAGVGIPDTDAVFTRCRKYPGYAHYRFEGVVRKEFKEALKSLNYARLAPSDIINIVDDWCYNFGATCNYDDRTGAFNGHIYTD